MEVNNVYLLSVLLTALLVVINSEEYNNTIKKNSSYDPAVLLSQIFNPNNTIESRQSGYGLIKFEGQPFTGQEDQKYGLITFEDRPSGQPLKFEDNGIDSPSQEHGVAGQTGLTIQEDNRIGGQVQVNGDEVQKQKKRKRRRRRKPRLQGHPGYPGIGPGIPIPPGQISYLNPGHYRPHRRPRPSIASDALTAVTGALSSIAQYDDYQCVPRLLCEAAEGGALGSGGSSGVLQSIAALQPLLTLLSAYNGVSTSPLFVFGRAVFLGMTSKNNPGTCRYAYPLCPTDPEQLVHYLNNHNGGFFRFFSAPHLSNPQYGLQNLEQFYNQLMVPGLPGQNFQGPGQNYGLYQPGPDPNNQLNPDQQNYGLYNNLPSQQIPDGFQKPGIYNGYLQNYGSNYPYDQNKYGFQQNRFKNNEELDDVDNKIIQKRIQNKRPDYDADNSFDNREPNSRWLFPEDVKFTQNDNINNIFYNHKVVKHLKQFPEDVNFNKNVNNNFNNYRVVKHLKFPEETANVENDEQTYTNRKARGFTFPGTQSHRQYTDYYDNNDYQQNPTDLDKNVLKFDISYGKTEIQNDAYRNMPEKDDDIEIVYVVRGNGDPNNPEIVKLKPGQTI